VDVFLHLGAHKTATSYIQACLHASKALFDERGCRLVTQFDLSDDLRAQIRTWQSDLDSSEPLPAYQEFLHELVENDSRPFLLSFEGLVGRLSLALHGTIYPSSAKTIEALRCAFAGHRVRVGFAIRNYTDLICSTYSESVNGSFSMLDFEQYRAKVNLANLTWVPVVTQLRAAFGEENVKVWSYEEYRQDPQTHNRSLLEFFWGPGTADGLRDLGGNQVRSSTGVGALELQRRLNQTVRGHVKRKDRWRAILTDINEVVRDTYRDVDDPPPALPRELQDELDDRYRRHCRELAIHLPVALRS